MIIFQGFHWSHAQATVHPFVVHFYDEEGIFRYKSYCVISDERKHDTNTFEAFKIKFLEEFKKDFKHLNIKHIHYVSDGCAGQYKNYKNFHNLCQHKTEFGISASWHFTATSHGKSTCDAISAVVKKNARMKVIRDNELITTAKKMYEVCRDTQTTQTLVFIYISKEEVAQVAAIREPQYLKCKSIAGTRNFHFVEPLSENSIKCRIYSSDTNDIKKQLYHAPRDDNLETLDEFVVSDNTK